MRIFLVNLTGFRLTACHDTILQYILFRLHLSPVQASIGLRPAGQPVAQAQPVQVEYRVCSVELEMGMATETAELNRIQIIASN